MQEAIWFLIMLINLSLLQVERTDIFFIWLLDKNTTNSLQIYYLIY